MGGGVKSTLAKKTRLINGLIHRVHWLLMVTLLLTTSTAWSTPLSLPELWQRKEVVMSNSKGLITAPVDLETDVYKVLGIGATASGYDVGHACQSDKINIWSRKKPVRYQKLGELTEAEFAHAFYGISEQDAHSVDVIELFKRAQASPDWVYLKPEGGNSSPFRITDFIGYNHTSVFPYKFQMPSILYIYGDGRETSGTFLVSKQEGGGFTIQDLYYMMDLYGGYERYRWAVMWKPSGSTLHSDVHFAYGPYVKGSEDQVMIEVTFPSTGSFDTLLVVTNETTETTDAYDSIYIPRSSGSVTVQRKYDSVVVTITNATELQSLLSMASGVITGFNYVYLSMKPGEGTTSTSGNGRLDLWVTCYDGNNNILEEFQLRADGSVFSYSGGGTVTTVLDYMIGGSIDLSNYIDSYSLSQLRRVEMIPVPEKENGNAVFYMDKTYRFTASQY